MKKNLRLAIIDEEGNIHQVDMESLNEFNLDKPLARICIMEAIQRTIEEIEEN